MFSFCKIGTRHSWIVLVACIDEHAAKMKFELQRRLFQAVQESIKSCFTQYGTIFLLIFNYIGELARVNSMLRKAPRISTVDRMQRPYNPIYY